MKKILYAGSYLAALVIGVLMLIFNYQTLNSDQPILRGLIIAAGILFIVPGLLLLIGSLSPKRDENGEIIKRPWYTTVIAILALVWGILLICMPSGFMGNLNITLGVSLIILGIAQISWIIRSKESTFWRFIIPALVICLGIVTLSVLNHYPDAGQSAQWAAIVSGLALVFWGFNGFASLRSKRVVAAEHAAGKIEKKAEKEEKKAEKEAAKEEKKEANETEKKEVAKAASAETTKEEGTTDDASTGNAEKSDISSDSRN